ncbi:unnamed protein product [Thlaspi arvense]|uniref:Polymerase nucleotidyl transferase domain-containing protein n=1 Tax=Thlaspi arvense TaxID=13288 RepID=A0AAU9SIA6_THLAR|nr:unnamed protein product [Thlaspi arvense]
MAADLDDWSVLEESSSSFSPLPPPRSPSNQSEFWERVEEATREIIEQVHPTLVSEDRRRDVIDFVQRLLKMTLGCEVHSFGSVPLKTYLPDGDIDLTAFGGLCHEEELALKVFSVLEREEHNGGAYFMVKDVQLIRAEVKLVKCLVQNIVVDISFNQLGGICTLCFLEKINVDHLITQIDHFIGKDHLFKRSIILIKAWCYYESRILGALHGLISTYALETLVLYIFHLFHSSLDGPLAVLYKFLDYFSKFDWDNYCISLSGPVCLSSLPEIVVETPENGGQDLLLTSEFLKECLEMYISPALTANHFQEGQMVYETESSSSSGAAGNGRHDQEESLYTGANVSSTAGLNLSGSPGETAPSVSEERFAGDAKDLATVRNQKPEISVDAVKSLRRKESVSPLNGEHHSLHQMKTGEVLNGNGVEKQQDDSCLANSRRAKDSHSNENQNENEHVGHEDLPSSLMNPVTWPQEDMHLHYLGHYVSGTPNLLSDLTGDYDSQLNSLRYGRWWFDCVQNGHLSPLSPPGIPQLPNNNSWEVIRHAPPFRRNASGPVNANGVVQRQVFFHVNPQMIPPSNFAIEEVPKPRGTGTYFPNAAPDFRSMEPLRVELLSPPEGSTQSDVSSGGSYNQPTSIPSSTQEDRVTTPTQSYHLTDDHEFPPL